MNPEELVKSFHHVVSLVRAAPDPQSGFTALVQYLDPDRKVVARLAKVDIGRDIASVRSQLQKVIKADPPPSTLNAIYFGLFDTEDDEGEDAIGYYVAGAESFDPDEVDTLVNPAWFPEGRYLKSKVLEKLKQAELAALDKELDDLSTLLSYAGQIGLAMLVSKFASEGLFPGLRRVVGFDSGDFEEIDG